MLKKYELLLTLPGTLDEKEAAALVKDVAGLVKEINPEAELNNLGKMRLAYPIKQIRYGYFYTVVFQAEPADVKKLEEKLRRRGDLLRAVVSLFNTNITAAKKIMYTTSESGVTTMVEKAEDGAAATAVPAEEHGKPVDLKDIDKKLDEILGGEIIPGV